MGGRRAAVKARAEAVEDFLKLNIRGTIKEIAYETFFDEHLVRYALRTLCDRGRAHVERFDRSESGAHVAIFKIGPGDNAKMIEEVEPPNLLDFESTRHLQPFYVEWTAQREPIDLTGEDDAEE